MAGGAWGDIQWMRWSCQIQLPSWPSGCQSALAVAFSVVASGGGTFADASNRELMLRDGGVVWLDAPFETVLQRVPQDGRRPLAADRLGMEQLYNQRLAAYRQAHLRVDAGRGSVEELVDHIMEWLET